VELRARGTSVRERAAEAGEQAKAALDANQHRIRRAEAALKRAYAGADRDQASAARLVNPAELNPPLQQRNFANLADRVSALRHQTAAAAAHLAETEEQAARIYDGLAASKPGHPEYKRMAEEAREAMRRARDAEQKYRP